jgi:diguanylate cyclase (GGDEF)-like protein
MGDATRGDGANAARRSATPPEVRAAIALDALALSTAAALVVVAAAGLLSTAVVVAVVVAVATALALSGIGAEPARPGSTGRLLPAETVVVVTALASLPVALGFAVQGTASISDVTFAVLVAVALAARVTLLTRRADEVRRAQAGRVAELARIALHDPLTGLPNRTLLEDRLALAMTGQRRTGSLLAVLFCDLDGFKQINDIFGHDNGDIVLQVVATRLSGAVRSTDTVSRIGGDEFVIVCPDIGTEVDLDELADRLLKLICEPIDVVGEAFVVSGSLGMAVASESDPVLTLPDLLRRADVAMYRAKAAGRNRATRFGPRVPVEALHRYQRVREGTHPSTTHGRDGVWAMPPSDGMTRANDGDPADRVQPVVAGVEPTKVAYSSA